MYFLVKTQKWLCCWIKKYINYGGRLKYMPFLSKFSRMIFFLKVWSFRECLRHQLSEPEQFKCHLFWSWFSCQIFLFCLPSQMAIIFEKEKLTMVYHLQLSEPTLRHQIKEQFKVVNWGLRRKDFGTKKKKKSSYEPDVSNVCFQKN